MRMSVEYLKQNEDRWRCRKIDECERIKEEEKKDRLAIVKGKKKRYGLQKLSKEENRRLKSRTEDRIEIAKAKENYWRKFRQKNDNEMEEEEDDAWRNLEKGILMLEERGTWIQEERKMENIKRVPGRRIDSMSGGTGGDDDLENLRLGVRGKLVRKGVLESVKESGQEVCEEEFNVTVRNIRQEAVKVIEEAREPSSEEDSKRMGEVKYTLLQSSEAFSSLHVSSLQVKDDRNGHNI